MAREVVLLHSIQGGLITLTKSLAKAFAPEIRVNAVCPGVIQSRWLEDHPEMIAQAVKVTPLKRASETDDIADAIVFLACDAHMMTGQALWSMVVGLCNREFCGVEYISCHAFLLVKQSRSVNPQTATTNDSETTCHDPICGMNVEPQKAAGSYKYAGKTYYFCSLNCLAKFKSDPENICRERKRIILLIRWLNTPAPCILKCCNWAWDLSRLWYGVGTAENLP